MYNILLDYSAPLNLSEISPFDYSVWFEWILQESGSTPPTAVEIAVRSHNSSKVRIQTIRSNETGAVVSSLDPLTKYNFTFYVISTIGKSHPVTTEVSTLSKSMTLEN